MLASVLRKMDHIPVVDNAPVILSLDDCQDDIFRLYIDEKKRLRDVMEIIQAQHGIVATEAVYKAKLAEWNYHKNTKRHEAIAVLRLTNQPCAEGKDKVLFLKGQPVDMAKIRNIARRQKIRDVNQRSLFQPLENLSQDLVYRTPPRSPMQRPLASPQLWRVPEKLLYHLDIYIKGSFEAGAWSFIGNEFIISSSRSQSLENKSLHSFLGGIDTGCENFASGARVTGGLHWRKAFKEIDTLIRGTYHDTLPNIVQKINDLHQRGHTDAAIFLMKQVAESCVKLQPPGQIKVSIFQCLADMSIDHMQELETVVMTRYLELFELYLGSRCYNSFVMRMNLARRKLIHGGVTELDRCLPDLAPLDDIYGISNRRPLDVIRTRVEVLYENKRYEETDFWANMLIDRAILIENDNWQNFYFVSKGFCFVGLARYFLKDYVMAVQSLKSCIQWIQEFEKVDLSGLFDPEKADALEKLEVMALMMDDQQSASAWTSQRVQALEIIAEKESIP